MSGGFAGDKSGVEEVILSWLKSGKSDDQKKKKSKKKKSKKNRSPKESTIVGVDLTATAAHPESALKCGKVWRSRVEDLLEGRRFGLFCGQVERMYERRWGETLPEDWLEGVEGEMTMVVEHPVEESGTGFVLPVPGPV